MAEDDHVGGDVVRVAARVGPAVGHGVGQAPGPGVVVGQTVDHGREGDEAGGGDHAGLAHGPAQALALDAGPAMTSTGPARTEPTGRAQALGQTRHHRRHGRGEARRGDAGGHLGVEEAGAVHVDGECLGRGDDGVERVEVQGTPPDGHVGLLQTDEARGRVVVVDGRLDATRRRRVEMVPSSSSTRRTGCRRCAAAAPAS